MSARHPRALSPTKEARSSVQFCCFASTETVGLLALNFVGLVQYATVCLMMSAKELLCAFVLSRLDYCDSLLAGCPKYFLSKLRKVQTNAARLVFRTTRFAHVTYVLHSLHWLPIEQRIEYKLSLLCFKIISHQAPIYLSDLHLYTPSWQLRSSTDTRAFRILSFRTKSCGQRSFSYQAPVIWNQLPVSVRHPTPVSSFKSSLKTFLFLKTFSSVSLP